MSVCPCVCVKVVSAACYLASLQYIIHRDIAASNFLVTEYNHVKLADFGRARYVYDDNYQAERSEMISVKWSSPEVLVKSCYSTRSDVWAAAVVMWEVLSGGQRPYRGLTAEQTAVYVMNGGRLECPEHCPQRLYTVMRDCWRHAATDRPSANHVAYRLYNMRQNSLSHDDVTECVMSHGSLRHKLTSQSSSSAAAAAESVSTCSDKCAVTPTSSRRLTERRSTWENQDVTPAVSSSSSSSSMHVTDTSRSADDLLTRADKIRHSLRKLVNVRV